MLRMEAVGCFLSSGHRVAVTWDNTSTPERLQEFVPQVQAAVAPGGKVSVENVERLLLSAHADSSYDTVLLGAVPGSAAVHNSDVLAEVARILKPGGTVIIQEPVDLHAAPDAHLRSPARLSSALTLSGLTGVKQLLQEPLTSQQIRSIGEHLGYSGGEMATVTLSANKPNYEVGSTRQLSLSKRPVPGKPSVDPAAVKLWTLSASDMNDDDGDLLDSDELLDAEDLKKPLPSSLQKSGCGEGSEKKRKACKNCTCGLAEELVEEKSKIVTPKPAPSACGNCYLGDAFRCASCPYLGMPAFKPGEKVLLNPSQLQDS
ncbi:anamorsin isoform X2 [Pseudophryne corroboree]|uniref:anamorsin isoform X2 n=1 Tax=Pseudophryne corroboree TaxID=495146 RepID=UPI0030813B68